MSHETPGPASRSSDLERTIQTFSELADDLVNAFVLPDFLGRVAREAVRLLPVDGAAILVARGQTMELVAATDPVIRRLEEMELAAGARPCVDTARDKSPRSTDLAELQQTWPLYAANLMAAGYRTVHAVQMRERDGVVGAMNFLSRRHGPLPDCDLQVCQALADLAAVAVVLDGHAHSAALARQLQHALESRIVVEQAKGVIAEHAGVEMTAAFGALRSYARARQTKLSTVARAVIERKIHPRDVLETD
jgi:hypothetical protein